MTTTHRKTLLGLATLGLLTAACSDAPEDSGAAAPAAGGDESLAFISEQTPLKQEIGDAFLIGTTLNADQIMGQDPRGLRIAQHHYNAISPENVLKWEVVHPEPERFDFTVPDRYVQFGEENDMYIVGHTLVWHSQTPEWVWEDAQGNRLTREALLQRMREHIRTVMGRYKGRIDAWDVVNEALNEDGTLRQSPWLQIIGEDYIAEAFRTAHEVDPEAKLYYNDYSLERPDKRAGAVRLVRSLQQQGVPIHGVGMQGHLKMDWPTVEAEDSTIRAFADLGLEVAITELDIDVLPRATSSQGADVSLRAEARDSLNPYAGGLPDSVQQALAQRYADFFDVYMRHRDVISRVTFWGVSDGDSWLNNWPVPGRTNYPLLTDREGRPKPAWDAVVRTARNGSSR